MVDKYTFNDTYQSKPIDGYSDYLVDEYGNVWSNKTQKYLN